MFQRKDRVTSLIHGELSKILLKEVEFPGTLITIVSVDIDKKMERALIGVSVHPSPKGEDVVKNLEKRAGYFQHLLLKKINIKPMPRIMFRFDRGYEHAAEIEKLLIDKK